MNSKFKLYTIVFLALLFTNRFVPQEEKAQNSDGLILMGKNTRGLIFIESIPKSNEILAIEIKRGSMGSSSILDESDFLNALDYCAKSLKPDDETISTWNYAPWYRINFYTSEGKYDVSLFLGGLSFITLPNGKKGAVLFDFSDAAKPK